MFFGIWGDVQILINCHKWYLFYVKYLLVIKSCSSLTDFRVKLQKQLIWVPKITAICFSDAISTFYSWANANTKYVSEEYDENSSH